MFSNFSPDLSAFTIQMLKSQRYSGTLYVELYEQVAQHAGEARTLWEFLLPSYGICESNWGIQLDRRHLYRLSHLIESGYHCSSGWPEALNSCECWDYMSMGYPSSV